MMILSTRHKQQRKRCSTLSLPLRSRVATALAV